jgi:sensor c-di-GMP phosphodiesterase-like protein
MNTARQRVRVTLAATILAIACGAGAGFLLGSGLALRQAIYRLEQDTGRLIAEENASLKETYATMKKMSSSPYPYCSEAEIAYFRKLLYQTDYLADGGRMHDGIIDCSVTLGKADLPREPMKPAFTMSGGSKVYRITGPLQIRDQITFGVQFKDLYVVINSGVARRLDSNTLPFIMTLTPASGPGPGMLMSTTPQPDNAVFTQEGLVRKGKTLYFTRCTADKLSCTTTHIAIPDAIQADRAEVKICMALGGMVGALFGFLISLVYRRSRSMEQQLRRAIQKDKLRMVYQPIVDLATKRIVGAEALARWTDEEGFTVSPEVFVRLAEGCGFVGALTRLVVRHALRDFGAVLRSHPDFRLSINVAAADLSDPAFLPMLEEALILSGVQAQNLAIEITESSTARHEVAIETIRRLQEMGHSVHIDDFGTGYSSLSYLQDLAISAIKIDKSFTRSVGTQAVTVAILPQILAMADALNLQVIVEGIETAFQADYFSFLARPVLVQGWFYGYPVPAESFHRLLAEDEKKTQVATAAL